MEPRWKWKNQFWRLTAVIAVGKHRSQYSHRNSKEMLLEYPTHIVGEKHIYIAATSTICNTVTHKCYFHKFEYISCYKWDFPWFFICLDVYHCRWKAMPATLSKIYGRRYFWPGKCRTRTERTRSVKRQSLDLINFCSIPCELKWNMLERKPPKIRTIL